MILETPRKRPRLLSRLLWPILITASAILALVVAGAGRDTRSELDYLEVMSDQLADLALGGQSLSEVSSRLFSIDRVEFVTVTDGLRADLAAGMELTEAGPPSESLVAANALYRQTLEAWTRGVTGFSSGVLVAADDPTNPVAVDNVADALAELRAGDELFLQLVAELEREEVPSPVTPLPEVVLMPAKGGLVSLSRTYVEAARSPGNTLTLRPGLGIAQIVADPTWEVDPEDQAVLPATDSVVFSVVVTNSGNVASFPETLALIVSGGPELVELTTQIEPLEPGRQRTVEFAPVDVEVGLVYEVMAVVAMSNADTNLEDNEVKVVFVVNEGEVGG